MPPPSVIQESAGLIVTPNNSLEVVETWNISADSCLVATVFNDTSANRTFGFEDTVAGDWIEAATNQDAFPRRCSIFYFPDHPGGSNVDIISTASGDTRRNVWVRELTKAALADAGDFGQSTGANVFPHAEIPGLSTPGNIYAVSALVHNSNTGEHTETPGWARVYRGAEYHSQMIQSVAALVDERAIVTSIGNARSHSGVVAAFVDASAPAIGLTVQDSQHQQLSEQVTLTTEIALSVQPSRHAQASDQVALEQASTLAVEDVRHPQASDQVTLATAVELAVLDSAHFQTSERVELTQASTLVLEDARHPHRSDQVTLTTGITLAVSAVSHAHTSEGLVLDTETPLAVADVRHVQRSDGIDLIVAAILEVLDSAHRHGSQQVVIIDDSVGIAEREGTLVYIGAEPLVIIEIEPLVRLQ